MNKRHIITTKSTLITVLLIATAVGTKAADVMGTKALDAVGTRASDEQKEGPLPWSIGVNGSFSALDTVNKSSNVGVNTYSLSGQISVGYFATDHFKFEGSIGAQTSGDRSGFNQGGMSWLAAVKYYVSPYSEFTPYLGVQGGAFTQFNPGSTMTDPAAGGMVGFEYYLDGKRSTSLFVEYNFLYVNDSLYNQFQNKVILGITFHFGK
jgi:outer membrane protein W